MNSTQLLATWPVENVSVAAVKKDNVKLFLGDQNLRYKLASVTKLLASYAMLIAVEEGAVDLDRRLNERGETYRKFMAHVCGYDFDTTRTLAEVGERRMYSNTAFRLLAEHFVNETQISLVDYISQAIFEPLDMQSSEIISDVAAGGVSTAHDLAIFAAELLHPKLVSKQTLDDARSVQFPGLAGVLPGYGAQRPNDWGLGFELKSNKNPHWTGKLNSAETFGHFGQSGTFIWVDPKIETALVVLSDRAFGPWAKEVWAPFSDQVIKELCG